MRDAASERVRQVRLGDIARVTGGKRLPKGRNLQQERSQFPYIRVADFPTGRINLESIQFIPPDLGKTLSRYSVSKGDLIVSVAGTLGVVAMVPEELDGANLTENADRISEIKGALPEFLLEVLRSDSVQTALLAEATQNAQPKLALERIRNVKIDLPPLTEQRKIAEILRTWDEALEKLTALRAAKVRRISSLRQRLFEEEYSSHNRLQRAKDLFETVSERGRTDLPLLAVMQDIGIVRRDELDRRVAMPDGDTSTYKVVRPGDFVISLRSFEGGLEFSSITGLVSPAYTVLRPTTDLIGDYYRHFFKSRSFIGRLDKLIFGIRDGKQIAFRDFGDMYIPAPPVAEQEAQARALGSLEADLALEDERIAALTRQKRGLMQKLLTGEWRVATAEATEVAQ